MNQVISNQTKKLQKEVLLSYLVFKQQAVIGRYL